MAAEFTKYGYPLIDSVDSWTPSRDPLVDGYDQEDDDGVSSNLTAGGKQVDYQISDPTLVYTHHFKTEDYAEVVAFRAFRDKVFGRKFQMTDPTTGGPVTVKFAPDAHRRNWTPAPAIGEWEVTIRLRRQVGV